MSNSLNIKWYSTIKTKIAIALIVPVFLLLGGFTTYSVWSEYQTENKELQDLSQVSSERIANHLQFPMWDLDNERVKSAILAELKESRVYAIVVWDSEKKAIFEAKSKENKNGKVTIKDFNGSSNIKTLVSKSPIQKKDDLIGEVSVYVYKVEL